MTVAAQADRSVSLLAERLDRLTQTVALFGFAGLVCVAILTFYDGSARYLGIPRISGFSDYGELVYPIIIASCFPAGLLRQTNVTVRVLGQLIGARGTAILEAFAAVIVLAFFTVLIWQFVELTLKYDAAGRTTRTIEMQLAPAWYATTAIVALCLPVQFYVTFAWFKAAITGAEPGHKHLKSSSEAV